MVKLTYTPPGPLALMAYGLATVTLVLDQLSKAWVLYGLKLPEVAQIPVLPFFKLSMVWNRGVSFGLLASDGIGRWLLSLFSLIVAAALIWWARSSTRPRLSIALGLLIGGAIGNAIDRIRFGAVVDFLDFSGLMFPWVFNIADAAITIGVILLLADTFLTKDTVTVGSDAENK